MRRRIEEFVNSWAMPCIAPAVVLIHILAMPQSAQGFPQYEEWISKKAGFQTDCAYCHVNASGPMGKGEGQEGRLTADERNKLHGPDSPILNAFGQQIIRKLSYEKFVAGVSDPGTVVEAMKRYDLDGDSVSDGVEMEHGTLAYDSLSAPPALAWQHRLQENLAFVLTVAISAIVGAFGFLGLSRASKEEDQ